MHFDIDIDVRCLTDVSTAERGIPTYVFHVVNELTSSRNTAGVHLKTGPHQELAERFNALTIDDSDDPSPIFHNTSPFLNYADIEPRRKRVVRLGTAYDIVPFLFKEHYLSLPEDNSHYLACLEGLRQSDYVLSISAATTRDLVRHIGLSSSRVVTVGTGLNQLYRPTKNRQDVLAILMDQLKDLREDFILYTGGNDYRKNIVGLLRAFALLPKKMRRKHQLVVVFRVSHEVERRLLNLASQLDILDDLYLPGFVSDDVLLAMYQTCSLFVFPSIYEGFGLPLAEALACGAPAIAGDNSSLLDLVKNPHGRFNSLDSSDIARSMREALSSRELRSDLVDLEVTKTLTWKSVSEKTCDVYEDAARLARRRRVS